VIYAHLELLV